jgi:hypothetical protein
MILEYARANQWIKRVAQLLLAFAPLIFHASSAKQSVPAAAER